MFAVGAVWIGVLWGLMAVSSNPVIVNRVQILSSVLVVSGTRDAAKPTVLIVDRVLKGDKPGDRLVVQDWPENCPAGKLVVPLQFTRNGTGFSVTHGEWPNPAADGKPHNQPDEVVVSRVPPLVYPETNEVIQQVEALVGQVNAL